MMIKRTMAVQVLLLAAAVWAGYFLLNGPARAQEDEKEFVALFNGKDLAGWTGDTKNHVAQDGKIICPKGAGMLFTEKEYGDFVFRFEFKLTPGANNGVGIRTPLQGNPAYDGMEIQILDDRDPMYKDIQPWQVHGSIYGVAAAKRDQLKPAGEWNTEEITAKGRQVTVKVNGVTVADADIDKASTPKTLDGHEHPGLKNAKGHIGFLGHTNVIEFRNIRVKELK